MKEKVRERGGRNMENVAEREREREGIGTGRMWLREKGRERG